MTDVGITFREAMQGPFALGETDPSRGARTGRATELVLEATLVIPSIRRFRDDANHAGRLDGSISFPPFGERLAASGDFQLFAPTSDPDLKVMIYRASFQHAGRAYLLAGSKHVRRRSILHSWKDTTTLLCMLHEGSSDAGPVVGAGVLRLTTIAFARQLLSFGTVNARTLPERTRAVAGFFAFFAKELVDAYLLQRAG